MYGHMTPNVHSCLETGGQLTHWVILPHSPLVVDIYKFVFYQRLYHTIQFFKQPLKSRFCLATRTACQIF